MMYGFGDDQNPYTESVDLLEDLVIEFITEMTHRAMEIGRTGRVQVEDIVFLGKRILYLVLYMYLIQVEKQYSESSYDKEDQMQSPALSILQNPCTV